MTQQPTPGPWRATQISGAHEIAITTYDGSVDIVDVLDISQEQMANARLIAAAPELLEALKDAQAELEELEVAIELERGTGRTLSQLEKDGDLSSTILHARAAIAKATGALGNE